MNKYDWSNVPKEVKWIATDMIAIAYGYKNKPIIDCTRWHDEIDSYIDLNTQPFQGNWQDSLEERPK